MNGKIIIEDQSGIKKFRAREQILPGTILELPCANLDTHDLIDESKRKIFLQNKHLWIKYEVSEEFWEHAYFCRLPLKPDEHPACRAVKFSTRVFVSELAEKNRDDLWWLFPDVASINHACDPNCHFNKLQDRAENGICRLTVLKQMNPDDEITIDWYNGHDQRMAKMLEFGDECTSKDCIKCAERASDSSLSESPAEKRAKF